VYLNMLTIKSKARIESIIGNKIQDDEFNSLDDLRQVSVSKLEKLKLIAKEDEHLALIYLTVLATEPNKSYINGFVADVVIGDKNAVNWHKKVVIACGYGISDIFEFTTIMDVYRPLETWAKEYGFSKIKFDVDDWQDGVSYTGAPCVALSSYDYRTKLNGPLLAIYDEEIVVEKIDNVKVVALRWLVNYISKFLTVQFSTARSFFSRTELVNLLKQEFSEFSDSEVINSIVLFLEKEVGQVGGAYSNEQIPGFVLSSQAVIECI
jgi:hypothetical protein